LAGPDFGADGFFAMIQTPFFGCDGPAGPVLPFP